jgi:hypothetical protein
MWKYFYIFRVISRTRFVVKGQIIQKWGKTELWFFGTVLHINALYHCMQFKQIIHKGFQVMLRTNTTDGQDGDYMLSLRGA